MKQTQPATRRTRHVICMDRPPDRLAAAPLALAWEFDGREARKFRKIPIQCVRGGLRSAAENNNRAAVEHSAKASATVPAATTASAGPIAFGFLFVSMFLRAAHLAVPGLGAWRRNEPASDAAVGGLTVSDAEEQILTVFPAKCAYCHGPDGQEAEERTSAIAWT